MKLIDTIIFSFSILFMLIGIHQSMLVGFAASYWLFMLALGLLMWYQMRKKGRVHSNKTDNYNTTKESDKKKRKYKI